MNILKDLGKGFYTLLFIAPLFWVIPALIEGLQHFVEVQLGMFTIGDGVQDGKEKAIRLLFGYFKVISITIPALLILKLAANQWDKRQLFPLTSFEKKVFIAVPLSLLLALIFVFYFSAPVVAWLNSLLNIPQGLLPFMPVILLLIPMALLRQPFLKMLLRLSGINIEGKLSQRSYLFEILMFLFTALLLTAPMILHYKLGLDWAMGATGWELFGLLAADSVLVGFMALLMGLSMRLAVTATYAKKLTLTADQPA